MKQRKTFELIDLPSSLSPYDAVLLLGPKARLEAYIDACGEVAFGKGVEGLSAPLESISSEEKGGEAQSFIRVPHPKRSDEMLSQRVLIGALPTKVSRMNAPSRPDCAAQHIKALPTEGRSLVVVCPTALSHASALVNAVARALPTISFKGGEARVAVEVAVWCEGEEEREALDLERLSAVAEGVQQAAAWVDMPPEQLNVPQFVEAARSIAARYDAEIDVFEGVEVMQMGLGGLWGVGKAAEHPPALVVLRGPQSAPNAKQAVWVGKGIVYDCGGLSLKPKGGMSGMKMDMGGAAAVLAGFEAAARCGLHTDLSVILCLAENAIGPTAFRNDDVLTLYSGKTVEINNTDAEGRLVLGDGVAYACRHLKPSLVLDIATLTGAQLMATGRRHAGAVCNDEALESLVVKLGRESGDLAHALPYCPEFLLPEFKSAVADMKNSVKDRMNAQSSCAAHFVESHLVGAREGERYEGAWLHLDIAGPAFVSERGTGFGVALLCALHEAWRAH